MVEGRSLFGHIALIVVGLNLFCHWQDSLMEALCFSIRGLKMTAFLVGSAALAFVVAPPRMPPRMGILLSWSVVLVIG